VNILKSIPTSPGVYVYKDKDNKIIYIGKALNLKNRVSQYFQRDNALGPKTKELVSKIKKIDYKIVNSEIEALVLESKLIKKYSPKYNSQLKDNKSYLYITLHKDYIETTRQTGDFGPFPDGSQVKYLLKTLRRIFPFYTKSKHPKTCLYCHLGLCPKDEKENQKNIRLIKKILNGKHQKVINQLKTKISKLTKSENYEEAIPQRDSLKALEYISSGWKNISNLFQNIQLFSDIAIQSTNELESVLNIPHINRIECYDISQLGHKYFVGAMSVFQNGIIDKTEYRKFKIKNCLSPLSKGDVRRTEGFCANDPLMLKEIIYRRLKHKEWSYPDLIVLDGGKTQISAVVSLRGTKRRSNPARDRHASLAMTPVIGLVKHLEKIIVFFPSFVKEGCRPRPTGRFKEIVLPKNSKALQLLQQLRDEAHRFANAYRKNLISNSVK